MARHFIAFVSPRRRPGRAVTAAGARCTPARLVEPAVPLRRRIPRFLGEDLVVDEPAPPVGDALRVSSETGGQSSMGI